MLQAHDRVTSNELALAQEKRQKAHASEDDRNTKQYERNSKE